MLLFIDESGTDHKSAPYEVLAGILVPSRDLWNLIQAIRASEREIFGVTLSDAGIEFKGNTLLKRRVFRLASQDSLIPPPQRLDLCRRFICKGRREAEGGQPEPRFRDEFTAYGQACLEFAARTLALCSQYHARVFASMVAADAVDVSDPERLRRDYMVLFRRFGHFVEESGTDRMGLVIFDERDKAQSRRLCKQMSKYFLATGEGQALSAHIVPEPFFVHSDLTTAVRLADLVAYILNWGFRIEGKMAKPRREEIQPFASMVYDMSYKGEHVMMDGSRRTLFGISYLPEFGGAVTDEREG